MFENYGPGVYGPYYTPGAPVAGTDEAQTATFGGTWLAGDTFRLAFDGYTTAAIPWSAVNATLLASLQAATNALPNVGTNGIVWTLGTLAAGLGTVIATFSGGNLAKRAVALLTVPSKTTAAGTLAIAETQAGVTATYRDIAKGALLVDVTNAIEYIKTGAAGTGAYTKVGAQT